MIRIMILLVAVTVVTSVGMAFAQVEPRTGNRVDLDSLKQQRVQLLKDRVAAIKKWIDVERADSLDLIRPEMDLINAQLDYAESAAKRKDLLVELIAKYDILIKHAEFEANDPPPLGPGNRKWQMQAESDLFHLKAERVRIEILLNTPN